MKPFLAAAALAVSALVLAGCSDTTPPDDGRIRVVASTDVYGQIASELGGDAVDVTSLISSPSQDPHEFEPSASDQLAVNRADLVLQNGGGYDVFMAGLVKASNAKAPVLTAATYSSSWPGGDPTHGPEGFNEHVWYDTATMDAFATAIAAELEKLAPAKADAIRTRLASFTAQLAVLDGARAKIKDAHAGESIFVTEPVPLYLTDSVGLRNVTPQAFSEAVEAGSDVPPATLLTARDVLRAGDVRVVIVNAQAGGAETTTIIDEAKGLRIPVLEFAETLPKGLTYLSWMQRNIDQLAAALG